MMRRATLPAAARPRGAVLRPALRLMKTPAPLPLPRRCSLRARAAGEGGGNESSNAAGQLSSKELEALLAKYGDASGSSSKPAKQQQPAAAAAPARKPQRKAAASSSSSAPLAAAPSNGVFVLLLLNLGLFVADHVLHLPGIQQLYLNHLHPQWWQWLTHAFCHASAGHLMSNMFNLVVFGKLVEETEGAFGLVFTYVACALGAAAFAVLTQPAVVRGAVSVSLGASGAIFGLFAVAVLARISWDPRRLLESVILGWFVTRQVVSEAAAQVSGGATIGGLAVGHLAHLGGALAGVLLVLALKSLPDPGPDGAD